MAIASAGCSANDSKLETQTQAASQTLAGAVQVRKSGKSIEVWVKSKEEFPDSALAPLLFAGKRVFALSKNPPNGDPRTLIFLVSPSDYASLADGESLTVRLGNPVTGVAEPSDDAATTKLRTKVKPRVWSFGTLDKSKMEAF